MRSTCRVSEHRLWRKRELQRLNGPPLGTRCALHHDREELCKHFSCRISQLLTIRWVLQFEILWWFSQQELLHSACSSEQYVHAEDDLLLWQLRQCFQAAIVWVSYWCHSCGRRCHFGWHRSVFWAHVLGAGKPYIPVPHTNFCDIHSIHFRNHSQDHALIPLLIFWHIHSRKTVHGHTHKSEFWWDGSHKVVLCHHLPYNNNSSPAGPDWVV